MSLIYLCMAIFLLVCLLVNIWRVMRGPTVADSILASQIFGTIAIAILVLLSQFYQNNYLQDVALVFALLSPVMAVGFVRRVWADQKEDTDDRI